MTQHLSHPIQISTAIQRKKNLKMYKKLKSQQLFTCSKSKMETQEQYLKSVQS